MDSSAQPVPDQKTLVLVNTFVGQCTLLLNNFSTVCEQKLNAISSKIRRMDARLSLLEAKLRSIDNVPGKDSLSVATALDTLPDVGDSAAEENSGNRAAPSSPTASEKGPRAEETPSAMVKDDPQYATYFKMLSVGVPEEAVKIRMQVDGLLPQLLDTPDAPLPTQQQIRAKTSVEQWGQSQKQAIQP